MPDFLVSLAGVPTPIAIMGNAQLAAEEAALAFRKEADSLLARIALAVRPSGAPRVFSFGAETLRRRAAKLATLESGIGAVLVEAFLGDSWTANEGYWLQMHAERMVAEWGDAGPGWIGFGLNGGTACQGNARGDLYGASVTAGGGWTSDYANPVTAGPSLANLKSSTVGDKLTIVADDRNATGKVPTVVPASARLFWKGTANGAARYRWFNGATNSWGGYSTLGLIGPGNQNALIGSLPPSARWRLEIEVTGGVVELQGVDVRGAGAGYVAHKLAASGSRAEQWVLQDAAQWILAAGQLGFDAAYLFWGTNESAGAVTKEAFANNVEAMAQRCRLARPGADICLIVPPENTHANPVPMADYASAAAAKALALGAAFIDLQSAFGVAPASYDAAAPRPLLAADGYHPVGATTAPTIPDALRRAIGVKPA